MAKKTCPECGAEHGSRKLACDCGHEFQSKNSHPLYPEPGAWVANREKGLPKIQPPDPLPPGPVDASTVKEAVSYEGLGFTIYSFIPAKRISDPELRKLWREARTKMQKVVEYLDNVPG